MEATSARHEWWLSWSLTPARPGFNATQVASRHSLSLLRLNALVIASLVLASRETLETDPPRDHVTL